jgi:hypothetical protein
VAPQSVALPKIRDRESVERDSVEPAGEAQIGTQTTFRDARNAGEIPRSVEFGCHSHPVYR